MIITIIINNIGDIASAAAGVDEKVINMMILSITFGNAIATMVVQNIGAKQYERASQCLKYGVMVCFAFAVIVVKLCQINPIMFVKIFASDIEATKQAALYLQTFSLDCLCTSFVFCCNGYLNGYGKTVFTMAHSLIATFIGRIPLTIMISMMPNITLWHMGIAAPVSTAISIIMCLVYLKKADLKKI